MQCLYDFCAVLHLFLRRLKILFLAGQKCSSRNFVDLIGEKVHSLRLFSFIRPQLMQLTLQFCIIGIF